jgi:hypothetical protein
MSVFFPRRIYTELIPRCVDIPKKAEKSGFGIGKSLYNRRSQAVMYLINKEQLANRRFYGAFTSAETPKTFETVYRLGLRVIF